MPASPGLHLLSPWNLLLLVPLLAAWWWQARRKPATLPLAAAPLLLGQSLPPHAAPRSRATAVRALRSRIHHLGPALEALALLLLVVGLARPAESITLTAPRPGIDILLAIDVSSSMRATDLGDGATRLEAAKEAAVRFVTGRRDDRIGVLAFARYPDLLCPLTLDHAAVVRTLVALEPVVVEGPEDATALGAAVARSALVLKEGAERSRVLILLTDGEETVATSGKAGEIHPAQAAQLCAQEAVRVQAIGVGHGSEGARVVAPGSDSSTVDSRALLDLAARTGGTFHPVTDVGALDRVYARIDRLERAAIGETRTVVAVRSAALLWAALLMLVLGALLRRTLLRVLP